MGRITKLRLRDIRCFEGEQSADVSRITLLVGENSSGKSTFMGCYQALSILANMNDIRDANHFDREPFFMGPFDTIACSGKETFSLGGNFEGHCHTRADFSFVKGDGFPLESGVKLEYRDDSSEGGQGFLNVFRLDNGKEIFRCDGPGFRFNLDRPEISYSQISSWLSNAIRYGYLPYSGDPDTFKKRIQSESDLSEANEREVSEFTKFVGFLKSGKLPLPGKQPEEQPSFTVKALDSDLSGRMRYYDSPPSYIDMKDQGYRDYLRDVGDKLGLWKDIFFSIDPMSKKYEVLVSRDGKSHYNLMDVGYGVHSLLHVMAALYNPQPNTTFLLQQPEVHVHPSAQAKLVDLMVDSGHDCMIETHSDHILDHFRICVMEERLRPEDVSIVYFQLNDDGTKSTIHTIRMDDEANLLDTPDGYRKFFLQETKRLLGF